ncbi:unnamed protein product [Boreogadus saida]
MPEDGDGSASHSATGKMKMKTLCSIVNQFSNVCQAERVCGRWKRLVKRQEFDSGFSILRGEVECYSRPGEIWRYLVRSWSAFKSQMWRLQGYLTEKTLKSHLSFIEWTHWFANDHKDAPIGRLLHGIHHLFKL